MSDLVRGGLVAITVLYSAVAAAQLPPQIQRIESPPCASIAAPPSPDEALATGCYRPWPASSDNPDEQATLREQFLRWNRIWQSAQANSRGHYQPRRVTAEDVAALNKTSGAPAASMSSGSAVASWSGSGSKETESFTMAAGEWRVAWSAVSDSPVGGALYITVHAADWRSVTTISSGDIKAPRQDVSYVRHRRGATTCRSTVRMCSGA